MNRKKSSLPPSKQYKENIECSDRMTEKDLILETIHGNENAFAQLVDKYKTKVFHLAYQMTRNQETSDDLTQESFIKAYTSLDRFEFKSSFGTWLYRIALNHIRDHLRKETRMRPVSLDETLENIASHDSKIPPRENVMETKRQNQIIQEGIRSLPEKYRMIMILRDLQGFPYKDIAQILNISEGTVDSRLFRARSLLRKKISPFFTSRGGRHAV